MPSVLHLMETKLCIWLVTLKINKPENYHFKNEWKLNALTMGISILVVLKCCYSIHYSNTVFQTAEPLCIALPWISFHFIIWILISWVGKVEKTERIDSFPFMWMMWFDDPNSICWIEAMVKSQFNHIKTMLSIERVYFIFKYFEMLNCIWMSEA